jgi:hypothetical protein
MNFDLFDIMKSQNIPVSTVSVKSSSTTSIPRNIIRKLKINKVFFDK